MLLWIMQRCEFEIWDMSQYSLFGDCIGEQTDGKTNQRLHENGLEERRKNDA